MQRRRFLKSTIAGGLAAGNPAAAALPTAEPKYLALEWYRCRRDQDVNRVRDFFGGSMIPAYNRAGVRPVGLFQVSVGPDSPSFLVLTEYASMGAAQDLDAKLLRDEKWAADLARWTRSGIWPTTAAKRGSCGGLSPFPASRSPRRSSLAGRTSSN